MKICFNQATTMKNSTLESDLELESEDYDSLGGLIIEYLDRLPEVGDEVITENGIRLVVECLDKNRIESVHVYLPEDRTAVNIQNEEN